MMFALFILTGRTLNQCATLPPMNEWNDLPETLLCASSVPSRMVSMLIFLGVEDSRVFVVQELVLGQCPF